LIWQKEFTTSGLPYPAVDSANRCVLVVGTHRYVFAPDGTELQHTQLPIAGPTYNGGVGLAIDEEDNLFVGNSSGGYGKFDPSGQTIFTGALGNKIVYVSVFKGEALLTSAVHAQDVTRMAKLAADGTVLWNKFGVNGTGTQYRPAFIARFDTLGGVIGGGGYEDVVIGKYSAQNGSTWYSQTIEPGGRYAALDVDGSGNMAIAHDEPSSSGYTVAFYAGGIEHTAATLNRGITTEHSHFALHNSSDGYWRIRPGAVFLISKRLFRSRSIILRLQRTLPRCRSDRIPGDLGRDSTECFGIQLLDSQLDAYRKRFRFADRRITGPLCDDLSPQPGSTRWPAA